MACSTKPVQCLTCQHLNLRAAPELARCGFGKCTSAHFLGYVSTTYDRECAKHAHAEVEVVAKRRDWMEERK